MIPDIIKKTRLGLGESQQKFGSRFRLNGDSVSRWEDGSRQAPYKVIEFSIVFQQSAVPWFVHCPRCKGSGMIKNNPNDQLAKFLEVEL